MKTLIWILTGVGLGVAVSILLNQSPSQYATSSSDLDDAADQTSLWGSKQRLKGTGGNLVGKAKEGFGKATGDDELEGEGLVDQAVGAVKDTAGKAAHAVSDTIHSVNN